MQPGEPGAKNKNKESIMTFDKKTVLATAKVLKKSLALRSNEEEHHTFFFDTRDGDIYMCAFGEGYREAIIGSGDDSFDVPAVEFIDFLTAIDSDTIVVTIEDEKVKINAGSASSTFVMLKIPELPEISKPLVGYKIPDFEISPALFAGIDRSNPKFELNGLLVSPREGKIVSTDAKRLIVGNMQKADMNDIIIPKRMLNIGEISNITTNGAWVEFTQKGVITRTQPIIGRFPTYNRIIPSSTKANIAVNGVELKKRLNKMGDIIIEFEDHQMTVTDTYTKTSFSIVSSYNSEESFKMVASAKYIREAITDNNIQFGINSAHAPFTITSADAIVVIMPIILENGESDQEATDADLDGWEYTEPKRRTPAKRINKDKIIKEQAKEIEELKAELEAWRQKSRDNKKRMLDIARGVA